MKWFLVLLAACGDQGVSTSFEVHDTVHWSAAMTPDVVELRVDGELLPSDQWLMIDETYPSYAEAKAQFVPRTLELTTTTTTWTGTVELGNCERTPAWSDSHVLVEEAANYAAWRGFAQETGLGANRGSCLFADGEGGGWIYD
jgi:hypothetical protein